MGFHFDLFDFQIGHRRQHLGIPVDEALVFIDQTFAVKRHENLAHRRG